MNQLVLIAKREITSRINSVWFWVATMAFPVLLILVSLIPIVFQIFDDTSDKRIAVLDESSIFTDKIQDTELKFSFVKDTSLNQLKSEYRQKGYTAILYIPQINLENPVGIITFSEQNISSQGLNHIDSELGRILKEYNLDKLGLDKQELDSLNQNVRTSSVLIVNGVESENRSFVVFMLAYGLGLLMYFIVIIFGMMVMTSVLEEKTSRIIEVLASSVKPINLMFGKIFGLAGVVVIQITTWVIFSIVFMFGLLAVNGLNLNEVSPTNSLTSEQVILDSEFTNITSNLNDLNTGLLIPLFLIYLMLGYLIYSALFAAVGASVDSMQNANNSGLANIIHTPLVVTLVSITFIIENPQSGLTVFLSLFPLSSPVAMIARIPFGVPWWQIVISLLLMVLGFLGSTWMAAKIYRVGILSYGKKVNLRELWRWVRY